MRKIASPCELGDTEGPEITFEQILDFIDRHKGYIIFFIFLVVALVTLFHSGLNSLINSQLFFPDRQLVGTPKDLGMPYNDVAIETQDKKNLHGWWIPAPQPKAVLLFFHGNAGNISHRLENLKLLHQLGLACLILDYRGYGRSQGSPDEAGFYLDAQAAYGVAMQYVQRTGAPLVVFGRSLGGAAALEVGSAPGVAGVILESTFTNLGDMAKVFFSLPGLDSLLKDRFNSLARVEAVTAPMLFFHGDQDEIVPYRLGRALFDKAKAPKEFVTLSGAGHNDTVAKGGGDYLAKIASFVDSLRVK